MSQSINRREGKDLPHSGIPTNKCRRNDGNRSSPFGSHHTGDQESLMDVKAGRWRFDVEQDVVIISEYIPTKYTS